MTVAEVPRRPAPALTARARRHPGRSAAGASTRLERSLLFAFAAWAPIDSRVGVAGGLGLGTILLALLAVVVAVRHPRSLGTVGGSARMVPWWLFTTLTLAIELVHADPSLRWWNRLFMLGLGFIVVGAAARDRGAVQAACAGLLTGGCALAALVTTASWTAFASLDVLDSTLAQRVRSDALADTVVGDGSINTTAFHIGAAAAVGVALALSHPRRRVRVVCGAAAALCFVGTAFSVSRGALLAGVVAALVAVLHERRRLGRRLVGIVAVATVLVLLVPTSVFGRITPEGAAAEEKVDPRTIIWGSVVDTLGTTFVSGVGTGTYDGGWAAQHGFGDRATGATKGTHSSLTQILVYWGIVPLLVFLWFVVGLLRRTAMARWPKDVQLPVLTLLTALAVELLLSHSLEAKQYTIGFGLAIGVAVWRPRAGRPPLAPPAA